MIKIFQQYRKIFRKNAKKGLLIVLNVWYNNRKASSAVRNAAA